MKHLLLIVLTVFAAISGAYAQTDTLALADDRRLNEYFQQHNIHPQRTASGLYYVIKRVGYGPYLRKRQVASLVYTGSNLDGSVFDSNVEHIKKGGEPLKVHVGLNEVVDGLDEGLRLLKMNGSATFYLPSKLGYGAHPPDATIPKNGILIFDVEVTEVL